ncbi:MAG: hypothetical protein PHV33_12005 [Elusimicrobiales bacterium]|nr:hypothetical protein [Elusimicrobiales bacterium]
MGEYFRPWKLFTLAIGLALLVFGAFYYDQPDWDVGISFVMGLLAYFTAPWGILVLKARRWKLLPLALLAFWFTVDGSYVMYNAWVGRPVWPELRAANFFASSLLYLLCGFIWLPRMTFREVLSSAAAALRVGGRK